MDIKKISNILDDIDNGQLALPEFQRGYVWSREQIRGLFSSLYRRHPVGSLLVWSTAVETVSIRGKNENTTPNIKLLLDGQQRITSLYSVIKDAPPPFFDGNADVFKGLHFHLETETFEFYQPVKMKSDPLWISVTALMKCNQYQEDFIANLAKLNLNQQIFLKYLTRVLNLKNNLPDTRINVDYISKDNDLDTVVNIFNLVNSAGTKLSKGDLALATICATWRDGRKNMKAKLKEWKQAGYSFSLDWLLRVMTAVQTGKAQFQHLLEHELANIQNAAAHAEKHINNSLNMIGGRLGLDHDRVLFGHSAFPVLARYFELLDLRQAKPMNDAERDKLLFWFIQVGMWGRFSSEMETRLDKDLSTLEASSGNAIDNLLETLRLWRGNLRTEPGHFAGWSLGARFYPILYMLTRMGEALDLVTGLPLKSNLLGKMSKLEIHHIFPKAQLYKHHYSRATANALGNYCFLTKDSNLHIRDKLPEDYLPAIENAHPGVLASQWVPDNPELWKIEKYQDFLDARKRLLAKELNRLMEGLLHGDTRWLISAGPSAPAITATVPDVVSDYEEELELEQLNTWMAERGLPPGIIAYDLVDPETGDQMAVIDLAWPNGIQENLSEPVAVMLNEDRAAVALAGEIGLRCFISVPSFQRYVETKISHAINDTKISHP
jgi:hypothetical protein